MTCPVPERLSYEECRKRAAEGARRYWEAERPVREAKREATRAAAAAEIGALTQRELLIAGAIAYWCEGAKNKPYHRQDRVMFMNSDPGLITFFLRFLDAAGVGRDRLIYRVQIHESADVAAAEHFWLSSDRRSTGSVPQDNSQAAQPEDRPQERGSTATEAVYAWTSGKAWSSTGGSKDGRARPW